MIVYCILLKAGRSKDKLGKSVEYVLSRVFQWLDAYICQGSKGTIFYQFKKTDRCGL